MKGLIKADREALLQIFSDIQDDPNWFKDSVLYDLYSKRVPIQEFLELMSSDSNWSHMADKKQTKKIVNLFDRVYGYASGLSRIEEQNRRYQKNMKKISKPVKETAKVTEKKEFLKEARDRSGNKCRVCTSR